MKSCLPVCFLLLAICDLTTAADPSDGEKLFALKLQPLFTEKCVACHGADPEDIASNFDIRSRESMIRGGENFGEAVIIPGNGRESILHAVVTRREQGFEMPPKESEKLSADQIAWIRQWIDEGAPWPDGERIAQIQNEYAEGVVVRTSGGLSGAWTERRYQSKHLWAYQPVRVVQPPTDVHPIDWFIDRRLKNAGLTAAPLATATELARRLSFGLTGLPPKVFDETVAAFENDYAKNDPSTAVLEFATKLMSTPHYGEHFGRHWLDVARYADTAGFANDFTRPNAWRYRDYVIRAFNDDKPYNDFAREQIAGDEIEPDNGEMRIATGFLRMGPWEQTAMSVFRVTRQQWLDDVTDSVGQTFLGHALQCAKCHDHKFDPVPTRDYYRMMAVFTTTQFAETDTPFLPVENRNGFEAADRWTRAKIAAYEKQRDELNERVRKNRKQETADAKTGDNGLSPGDEASLARMNKNISRHTWELQKTEPAAFAVYTGKTIERPNVLKRIHPPADPWDKGEIEPDTILNGGDAYSRGDSVTPGALSAAESLGEMSAFAFPAGKGKRRTALADWIVDASNPLTARVIVNRVWSWHFGRGIAGNPNNLGSTGKLPTHPELLDFLAHWFVENDWSIKELNKLIVTSEAYRRSARCPDPTALADKDPTNETYAVFAPRRLSAEELRDAMLAISGELNRQVGGVPCRPDINMEVAMQPRQIMGGSASVYEPDPLRSQRNRRTIYAEKIRGLRDPFMETFNQPGPDKSCESRETSTVTPQALTLFNAEEAQDRALVFADRLIRDGGDESQIIEQAFKDALGRRPTGEELAMCIKHWADATKEEDGKQYPPRTYQSELPRTVMAEKTGEPYDFIEIAPAYENYEPDLQPSDVDPRTRGLAQVCLVIFNLNEFAYLD
ncbi:MAG: PSD1 domain-containing protein [Planctomycetales bacterium]|nr:PSD1 domain-containing protein [Planctomycetales bacterium]